MDALDRNAGTSDNAGVRIVPPVVLLICAAVCTAAEVWLDVPRLAVPQPAFLILGLAVIAGGIVCGFTGMRRFIVSKVNPAPYKPAASLVTSGIYRITRNPMYLGMVALFVGLAIVFGSITFVAGALVMFLYFSFYVIPREEAYLGRAFPVDYSAYRAQVRRWL